MIYIVYNQTVDSTIQKIDNENDKNIIYKSMFLVKMDIEKNLKTTKNIVLDIVMVSLDEIEKLVKEFKKYIKYGYIQSLKEYICNQRRYAENHIEKLIAIRKILEENNITIIDDINVDINNYYDPINNIFTNENRTFERDKRNDVILINEDELGEIIKLNNEKINKLKEITNNEKLYLYMNNDEECVTFSEYKFIIETDKERNDRLLEEQKEFDILLNKTKNKLQKAYDLIFK